MFLGMVVDMVCAFFFLNKRFPIRNSNETNAETHILNLFTDFSTCVTQPYGEGEKHESHTILKRKHLLSNAQKKQSIKSKGKKCMKAEKKIIKKRDQGISIK